MKLDTGTSVRVKYTVSSIVTGICKQEALILMKLDTGMSVRVKYTVSSTFVRYIYVCLIQKN